MRTVTRTLALLTGALTLAACGAAIDNAATSPTDDPSASSSPTRTRSRAAAPVAQEGTLEVGKDIRPGTYKGTVPADSIGCYWARLKGTSGQLEDVISNGLAQAGQRVIVTVKATDKAVQLTGCGHLTRS